MRNSRTSCAALAWTSRPSWPDRSKPSYCAWRKAWVGCDVRSAPGLDELRHPDQFPSPGGELGGASVQHFECALVRVADGHDLSSGPEQVQQLVETLFHGLELEAMIEENVSPRRGHTQGPGQQIALRVRTRPAVHEEETA